MTPESSCPEFSRLVPAGEIGGAVRTIEVNATAAECAALAVRFDLLALDALDATFSVRREGGSVRVMGQVSAKGFQPCGLSGAPVNFSIDEPVDLRFAEIAAVGDEVELSDADLDILPLEAEGIDLGEAAAQSLGLALDPYPRAADAALPPGVVPEDRHVPLKRVSPFAGLKG